MAESSADETPADEKPADEKRARGEKGRGKAGRGLSLLAWAGLGFAASRARQRARDAERTPAEPAMPSRSRSSRQQSRPTPTPEPAPAPVSTPPLLDPPADLDLAWIPGPGGSLRVGQRRMDAPAAIVHVHSLGGTLDQWAPALGAAGDRLRPIAFDLPGHGGSDGLEEPTFDLLAASLGAVVDGLGLRRVALVGHSLGASVAIRWAGLHPHRVAGLLLVDPNGDQTRLPESARESVLAALARDAAEGSHDELAGHYRQFLEPSEPEVRERVLADLAATSTVVLHDLLAASFAYSPLEDLDRYRAEGGVVRAITSPANDAPISLHRLRPDLELAVVEGTGHWLMLDRPDVFLDLRARFLADCADRL